MAFSPTLLDRARALAARYVGDFAGTAAAMNDPMAALERLGNASMKVWSTRNLLLDLQQQGLVKLEDVKGFDVLRANLYAAEMTMYTGLVSALSRAGVPASTLQEFPRPVRVPALNELVPVQRPTLQGVRRRAGFKAAPAAAAAAPAAVVPAVPAILIWAFAIIGLLVALALVAAVVGFVLAADQIAAVFVVEAQTEQLRVFYEARLAFYRGCLSAGTQTPQQCAALAMGSVPAPIQALPPPPGTGLSGWVWAAAGMGAIAVVGIVTYLVRGGSGSRMYRLR